MFNKIVAVGHRVVHGGYKLNKPVIINNKIIKNIQKSCYFAPIHNPLNIVGIKSSLFYMPHLYKKNVAVFDTFFHSKLPKISFLYAIPYKFYKKNNIRKYGAHGISYSYVLKKSCKFLNKKKKFINLIICHLGNGSSISAIYKGRCIDTSMGLTPLEGLVMGTRSGDIDPSVIFFLHEKLNISIKKIKKILNKKSGMLGLNEFSNDCRQITNNYFINKSAKRSIDIFCYRLSKYIASYFAVINSHIDGIVFTGGIGENSYIIRKLTIQRLSILNLKINKYKNILCCNNNEGFINKKNTTPILVIKTNEELSIALDTAKIIM
ncbi:acetate/propionate family kinase [Buchnera aphidicola (Taiwanaphis decaspermi)]